MLVGHGNPAITDRRQAKINNSGHSPDERSVIPVPRAAGILARGSNRNPQANRSALDYAALHRATLLPWIGSADGIHRAVSGYHRGDARRLVGFPNAGTGVVR